jgi:hypothetical protein
MKINVVNRHAQTLWQMYGITPERSDELFELLDKALAYHCKNTKTVNFSVGDLHQSIAEFCSTPEELIFCIFINSTYLHEHGMLTNDPVNFKMN